MLNTPVEKYLKRRAAQKPAQTAYDIRRTAHRVDAINVTEHGEQHRRPQNTKPAHVQGRPSPSNRDRKKKNSHDICCRFTANKASCYEYLATSL